MSRIGKMPVVIPAKVQITLDGNKVTVKGPKGQLSLVAHPDMKLSQENGSLVVTRPNDSRPNRELHGLTRALINNMVTGVNTGYRKTLIINGVGYRAEQAGKNLMMYLGYSHPIEFPAPEGISYTIEEKGTVVHIDGIDRQLVGQMAANLRNLRKPEPYHGKGIRYSDETIRMKEGKSGKK
jgi:large subunit ribosomal protein L6